MKKTLPLIILFFSIFVRGYSDEGMWIPFLLEQLNEAEMQAMGMRLSAEDIYSVNHSSLKDAVLIFGGGCTAEIVSDQGLILTNHHCGYSRIQAHSSLEHDYLKDGFWARSLEEELPNPGLTVKRLVKMEDVTDKIIRGVHSGMTENERQKRIKRNIDNLTKSITEQSDFEAIVKPFFYGNQYILVEYEIFRDVRLVGAPPSNIGKFGGDTDNWVWPRHTGDFSVFRIYTDSNNKGVEYNKNNRPYKPLKHFNISLKGVEEGDFTFVFGFPGHTEEYLPASAIYNKVFVENPIRIQLRESRLNIINRYMNKDPEVRIKYSAKQARIANGWKKWIGENLGIKKSKAIEARKAFEAAFRQWAEKPENQQYASLPDELDKVFTEIRKPQKDFAVFYESLFSVEAVRSMGKYANLIAICESKKEKDYSGELEKLKKSAQSFFKDYYQPIDKEIFMAMMQEYAQRTKPEDMPAFIRNAIPAFQKNPQKYTDKIFDKSIFVNEEKLMAFLNGFRPKDIKKIKKDYFWRMRSALVEDYKKRIKPGLETLEAKKDSLMKDYMKAQMLMERNKIFYPDANFTLRVSYGQIQGAVPADAVEYRYFTTLKGIMEKENPEIFDYIVEEKLKELYREKDFGQYADKDGTMHVGFIATNHTTGGNSGSPVLDADGNLIGINFDRMWEGTMSDLNYDPSICRNISLDIRYCLFIIDKYAGATRLIDEMTLVK